MDKFLETYKLLRLKYKEIEYLNRLIISKEIAKTNKRNPNKQKYSIKTASPVNFIKHKDWISILKLIQKVKKIEYIHSHFMKAALSW